MREYPRRARIFPLTLIRDDDDVRDATKMLAYVLSLGDDIPATCDYSEALGDLIWAYEQRTPAPEGTVSGALDMLMKGRGLTQTRLAREVGIAQATLSNVPCGARGAGLHRRPSRAVGRILPRRTQRVPPNLSRHEQR